MGCAATQTLSHRENENAKVCRPFMTEASYGRYAVPGQKTSVAEIEVRRLEPREISKLSPASQIPKSEISEWTQSLSALSFYFELRILKIGLAPISEFARIPGVVVPRPRFPYFESLLSPSSTRSGSPRLSADPFGR